MNTFDVEYDIIVIGAGHAGAESAFAAARMDMRVALVTLSCDKICEMPCNPAIGGLAKGHIVCEIDALGGLMGLAIDATGIQFRMLNRSKGPAVWGPRAQADKSAYSEYITETLQNIDNIDLIEGQVVEIVTETNTVRGVTLSDDRRIGASAVVVTTGTFLNGETHVGQRRTPAGRIGEPPAVRLSQSLTRLGLKLRRLKTGTSPRLARAGIDFDQCEQQPGDNPPIPFSAMTDRIDRDQHPCHVTYTNERTHDILRASLDRAPLYTGQIQSTGPRYCPSVETKVVRFADKSRHQIFLEPESLESDWIYCNGLATSLPRDVQRAMISSIAGLERAQIVQYGYAIEYDYVPPNQLSNTLEAKTIRGLFFAGQVNGTSGYEEAGGQGIIAGLNAARFVQDADPIVLTRDQAYIGVLIDDLVTKGVDEPYRMFTSRAEFRLILRSDTAARRLTPLAKRIGLIDEARWRRYVRDRHHYDQLLELIAATTIDNVPADSWLKRPGSTWQAFADRIGRNALTRHPERVTRQIAADIKYAGYENRERRTAEKLGQLERVKLPDDIDYHRVAGMKHESIERLDRIRPTTVGQASRIIGITPADIMVLMVHMGKVSTHSATI